MFWRAFDFVLVVCASFAAAQDHGWVLALDILCIVVFGFVLVFGPSIDKWIAETEAPR